MWIDRWINQYPQHSLWLCCEIYLWVSFVRGNSVPKFRFTATFRPESRTSGKMRKKKQIFGAFPGLLVVSSSGRTIPGISGPILNNKLSLKTWGEDWPKEWKKIERNGNLTGTNWKTEDKSHLNFYSIGEDSSLSSKETSWARALICWLVVISIQVLCYRKLRWQQFDYWRL